MHHWIIDVVTSKLLLKEATWWCSMVQKEYRSVGTPMSSKLDGYMCVQKMLVNVHCSPSPQHQYCWMHCHEFQDSRWQTLVACTTCNLQLQSSRQAKVFIRWAKDSCSSYFDAHSEGDKIFCTAISQYAFIFKLYVFRKEFGFWGSGSMYVNYTTLVGSLLDPKLLEWDPIQSDLIPWARTDEKLAMQKFPICSPLQGNEAFGVRFDLKLSSTCFISLIFRIFHNISKYLHFASRVSCRCCDLRMTKPWFSAADKVFAPEIMLFAVLFSWQKCWS